MLETVLVMVIKAERNKFCGTQTPATALESVFFYVYICIVSFFHLKCIPFTCVRRDILCIFLGDALNTHTHNSDKPHVCACMWQTGSGKIIIPLVGNKGIALNCTWARHGCPWLAGEQYGAKKEFLFKVFTIIHCHSWVLLYFLHPASQRLYAYSFTVGKCWEVKGRRTRKLT